MTRAPIPEIAALFDAIDTAEREACEHAAALGRSFELEAIIARMGARIREAAMHCGDSQAHAASVMMTHDSDLVVGH